MTGFASVSHELAGDTVNITVKSVNHRFLDVALKVPQALAPLDARVRAIVNQRLTRGRVELQIGAEVTSPPEREVVIDERLLDQVAAALESVRARGVVSGALTPSDLLRLPQVLEIRTRAADPSAGVPAALASLVELTLTEAIDALIAMRETEGRFIGADIEARLGVIRGYVDTLERAAAEGQAQLDARLRERIAGL